MQLWKQGIVINQYLSHLSTIKKSRRAYAVVLAFSSVLRGCSNFSLDTLYICSLDIDGGLSVLDALPFVRALDIYLCIRSLVIIYEPVGLRL